MRPQPLPDAYADARRISADRALEMCYLPGFLGGADADALFERLLGGIDWRAEFVTLFGRTQPVPRLVAWCGAAGLDYRYGGAPHRCRGWQAVLIPVRERLDVGLGAAFNFVLMNRYRSGADAMGWHADDEASLGREPLVASVSLGATRRFRVRSKSRSGPSVSVDLEHGSLLVAWGHSQSRYAHCVPRTRRPVGERINLTFRTIAAG